MIISMNYLKTITLKEIDMKKIVLLLALLFLHSFMAFGVEKTSKAIDAVLESPAREKLFSPTSKMMGE